MSINNDSGVSFQNVTHSYGSEIVLNSVSFSAPSGHVTALLGINGAGKSTLMKAAAGLLRPSAGSVRFGGIHLGEYPDPGSVAGFVLDPSALHPGRSVRETLRLATILMGPGVRSVDSVLDQVGLGPSARKRVGQLSLGMRQRLAIGVALLGSPRHIILDEPTNGLDAHGNEWMHSLLKGMARDGCSILVASHLLREVEALADRVVMIHHGKVIVEDDVRRLLTANGAVCSSNVPDRLAEVLQAKKIEYTITNGLFSVAATPAEVGEVTCRSGVPLLSLTESNSDLQSLFMRMTERS